MANRTFFIFIGIQLVSLVTAQEITKRVPQGFLGMRGKKQLDEDGIEQFYKRKPQFFVGVKGKKSLQDMLDNREEYYRTARALQMAFSGNKDAIPESESNEYLPKRDSSWIGQIDFSTSADGSTNYLDSIPILKELLTQYLKKVERPTLNIDPELESLMEPMSNEVDKRAANIHQFFGVRGKKSLNNKRPSDLSFRGKFIGVRGKKDLKNSGTHEIKFLLDGPLPKRKSQMGFFGMRGKKWSDTDESSQEMEMPN